MGRKKINIGNCGNGCKKSIHCRGVCRACYRRIWYKEYERENRGAVEHIDLPIGTIKIDKSGYARIKVGIGHGAKDWIKHHKFIMEQKLRRKLFRFENVHHKNGVKSDNRKSNLEIWITNQPKGQRPKDLIKYAKWILKTYGNKSSNSR